MKPTLARKIFCIAALFCAAAWNANANQVADPGFEGSTDNIGGNPFSSSWTVVPANDPFSGVGGDSAFAHSGTNYAFLGATPNTATLSQAGGVSTVATQSYSLSFWLANDITAGLPATNSFNVFFNGVNVFSLTNSAAFGYTQFTISNLVATGASTALQFVYRHDSDFWRLDDVNVSPQGVPEAFSTMLLAFPAFGALGLVHFSRARARKSLARI